MWAEGGGCCAVLRSAALRMRSLPMPPGRCPLPGLRRRGWPAQTQPCSRPSAQTSAGRRRTPGAAKASGRGGLGGRAEGGGVGLLCMVGTDKQPRGVGAAKPCTPLSPQRGRVKRACKPSHAPGRARATQQSAPAAAPCRRLPCRRLPCHRSPCRPCALAAAAG